MKASPELREKMWELCYDLLPDGERTALIAQIKSDPQVARLYAEVRLQADLVGYASTVEDPSLVLSADAQKLKMPEVAPAAGRRKEAVRPTAEAARGPVKKSLWVANAVAMAAGLALVLVMAVGIFRPQGMDKQLTQLFVTEIEVPGQLTSGLTTDFVIHTTSPAHEPVGVPVDVKVVDKYGEVLHRDVVKTERDGRGKVEVPGDAMIPGVRLQVEARREDFAEQQVAQQAAGQSQELGVNLVEAELPVTRQEPLTYFLLEKPTAQDGEKIGVAAWGLHPFGYAPAAPQVDDVIVTDHDSMQRIQPKWKESVQENMIEGTLDFSRSEPQPALEMSKKAESLEQLSLLQVERAKSIAPKDAVEDQTFRKLDQASSLSAGASAAPGQGAYRFQVRGVEENAKSAAPTAGDEGRTEIDNLNKDAQQPDAGKQNIAELKADKLVAEKQKVAMKRQVVAAGQPVEVELSADQAGKELEAIVMARDVEVVRQSVVPRVERSIKDGKGQEELAKVTLNVPQEVYGNLDVTLFDRSAADGGRVYHEYLYRSPARELKFQVLNLQPRYDPGERVQLKLKVVNENNEPQRAAVGARIWHDDYVPEDRLGLVMLSDVVRQETHGEAAEPLGELAQFGRPQSGAMDARSLGSILPGGSGLQRNSGLPKDADKGPLDQLAQQDARQPQGDLKKQDEAGAAGAPPSPAPHTPAPPLPAPLPSDPAEGLRMARSDRASPEALAMPEDATSGAASVVLEDATTAFAVAPTEGVADASRVTVTSNKAAIDRQVQSLKSESARALAAWQATVGRVLIGGGLVALAILGLLFAMRTQVRWSSGTLALVAAAASLVVGAVWIGGGRPEMTIAMTPRGQAPGVDAAISAPESSRVEATPMAAAPDSRFGAVNEISPSPAQTAAAPVADGFAAPELPGLPAVSTELSKEPAGGSKPLAEETATPLAATAPSAAVAAPAAAPTPSQDAPAPTKPAPDASKEKVAADKEADELKVGREGELKMIAPAKPAARGGKNAQSGSRFAQPSANEAEKSEDQKQSGGKAAQSAPQAGGFGGGSGRGGLERNALEPGGLGGRPNDAPGEPRPAMADRPDNLRARGAAAPTTSAPARPGVATRGEGDLDRNAARENRSRDRATAAPSAIYFNPQLATDADGLVTIAFQLPDVASEYRLLIDAYGNGRVGSSAEVRIVCQPAAK